MEVLPAGRWPLDIIASDLDGNGRMDLAAYGTTSEVSVLLGKGGGDFEPPVVHLAGVGVADLVAAELDGDGRTDLATLNADSFDVSLFRGRGDGTFEDQERHTVQPEDGRLIAADLDGDGWMELLTLNLFWRHVTILRHHHVDRSAPSIDCPAPIALPCTRSEGAVVDFRVASLDDCDAQPDIVCDVPSGSLFPPGTTTVTCTARDATGNWTRCSFQVRVECPGQVPGDCNQDGSLDISDPICLLHRLFGGLGPLPCGDGSGPASRELLDGNGDGALDLSDVVVNLRRLFLDGPPHALGEGCRAMAGCPALCL